MHLRNYTLAIKSVPSSIRKSKRFFPVVIHLMGSPCTAARIAAPTKSFPSGAQTISDWLYEQNHSRNLQAGMIAGLHTFGRDLKWNPHIHMILTEGALDRHGRWKPIHFFPYIMLRRRFMTTLLLNLKGALDPDAFSLSDFQTLTNRLYQTKDNGFYVHAPPIPDDGYDTLEESGTSIVHYWIGDEVFTETEFAQLKREQYIQAPPEGYTVDEIGTMSDDAILDMDYFLNE